MLKIRKKYLSGSLVNKNWCNLEGLFWYINLFASYEWSAFWTFCFGGDVLYIFNFKVGLKKEMTTIYSMLIFGCDYTNFKFWIMYQRSETLLVVIPNKFINLLLLEGGSRGSEKMMMHIIIFSWSTSLLTSLLSVTK